MAARNRVPKASWETGEPNQEPPRICSVSGKRMYATEHEANSTAAHRMADKETGPAHLRAYLCLYCGAWHLTSKQA